MGCLLVYVIYRSLINVMLIIAQNFFAFNILSKILNLFLSSCPNLLYHIPKARNDKTGAFLVWRGAKRKAPEGLPSQIRLDLVAQQVPCDDAVLGREAVDKVRAVEQLGTGREFVVARPQEHAQAVVPQQGELEARVAGLQGQAAHGGAGGAEGLQPRAEVFAPTRLAFLFLPLPQLLT